MNEDWLAEPVCRGFDSGYRVALMSGGSRRLWNQLLRGTPSSVPLFLPLLSTFVTYAQVERFISYRQKLLGQSRRTDSTKGQQSPGSGPPAYIRMPLLSSYNLRQLPRMTDSTAEIGL
ncbi:hypothetical protein X777_09566 [Ooceraea biroi]|uniref:Uncharacterized protein n=1 Tax=Ooceraea biroi TaxID=2015173 RepID=A0A026W9V9_OOCBI|nr:hypothetical protein X777_09566 [Ooceraea biroi]